MATDQLINKTQGDAIIAGLTAIKNAINDQPVPTQVEDVVSDAFDVGVSYVPGDYCIYENKLYKCDVAHHGAWDGNDFTLTNVGAELDTLNDALSALTSFIDTSNVITSSTTITNGLSKTASQNEWLYFQAYETSNQSRGFAVKLKNSSNANEIKVANCVSVNGSLETGIIPIKKGQVFTFSADGGGISSSCRYAEFGMQ